MLLHISIIASAVDYKSDRSHRIRRRIGLSSRRNRFLILGCESTQENISWHAAALDFFFITQNRYDEISYSMEISKE